MPLRLAVAADAANIAKNINAWAVARPTMFEDVAQDWTAEIAANEIRDAITGLWENASGVIRGIVIGRMSVEYEAETGQRSLVFEFRLLVIDPGLAVSPIAKIIDAVKQIAAKRGGLRLTGWIRDDSPAYAYLLGGGAQRCKIVTRYDDDDEGHTHYYVERQVAGTVG